jgi:hypothetical protein
MNDEIDLLEENPWTDFEYQDDDNYLDKDEDAVKKQNKRFQKDHSRRKKNLTIHTKLCPMPFVGDIFNAKVYILQANPGLMLPPLAKEPVPIEKRNKDFKNLIENCLKLKFEDMSYPFYFLDPKIWHINGSVWWRNNLEPILQRLAEDKGDIETDGILKEGIEPEKYYRHLATSICAIEIHGYRSRKFREPDPPIPSSKYNYRIVKHAMENRKVIVLTRSEDWWYDHVEGLKDYEHLIKISNPRNVKISKNNIENNGFREELIPALKF